MDSLAQLKAALADRYDIEREIGAGGMATVYLARDPRHDRHVALKLLKPELGAVLGVERFLAEIKVTANLQHPNLLPLFDSGEAAGLLFYVMPFVEGESLRARLDREKQLPVDEAIRIAVAVANALDYAHGHGVIHRDLKPENILLQHGQPVVADFGIALAVSNAGGNRITQTGLSLGTPQYMSPEQATGDRVIDGRSDIYSLAAMTYEMLTGEPPHIGNTAQAVIARVLTDRPRPIRTSRSAVPEQVEAALERALEKLPADRFSTAHEFADALQGRGGVLTSSATMARSSARPAARGWRERLRDPITVGLGVAAVASLLTLVLRGGPPATAPVPTIRFIVSTPDSAPANVNYPWPAAISPDGNAIVYAGRADRSNDVGLWLLRTDQTLGRLLPGTSGAHQVLFSPDGEWIAYEQGTKQWKLKLDGSTPVAITEGIGSNGIDWTTSDEIVLGASGPFHGLSHVSASGGELAELTSVDTTNGEIDHLWPIAHPDSRRLAFVVWRGTLQTAQLAIATLPRGQVTPLGIKGIRPLAFLDDHLVYVQADGAVMAVEVRGTAVTGRPIPVHDRVQVAAANNGNTDVFISSGGALVVAAGELRSRVAWMRRDGSTRVLTPQPASFGLPRRSPDGSQVAMTSLADGKSDVWILDIATSTLSRLTTIGTVSWIAWSGDGRYVLYSAAGTNSRSGFWRQLAAGGASAELLYEAPNLSTAFAVAPDGKSLVLMALRNNTWDLMRVSLDSGAVAAPYFESATHEMLPAFSPDGRWVAYQSDESGRFEVYIRSYPDPGTKLQVSDAGGGGARWSADGTSLFYGRVNGTIDEARLSFAPGPRVLGRRQGFPSGISDLGFGIDFDISRDGQQALGLLAERREFELTASPNWINEFRARVAPARRR